MTISAPISTITAETMAISVFMSPSTSWSYQERPASPSPPSDEPNEDSDHGLTSSGSTANRCTSPSCATMASQCVAALSSFSPSMSVSIIIVVGSSKAPIRTESVVRSNGSLPTKTQ